MRRILGPAVVARNALAVFSQIVAGGPADLFASADEESMNEAEKGAGPD